MSALIVAVVVRSTFSLRGSAYPVFVAVLCVCANDDPHPTLSALSFSSSSTSRKDIER